MAAVKAIEKFWYSNSWSKWLLWPLSFLLFLITKLKRQLSTLGVTRKYTASVPVIVIGNLTVGGTGKTPTIAMLCEYLKVAGYRVGIVSRGYQAEAAHFPFWVTDSDSADLVGDEVFMLRKQLGLPMAIGPERSKAVQLLIEKANPDIILSDDGLQHYKMDRQFEILVVDGERGFGNKLCLPFGPLREDTSRLQSVDYILQNGGSRLISELNKYQQKTLHAELKVTGLYHLKSGEAVSLNNLKMQKIDAVCGIGNPERFYKTLEPLCENVTQFSFKDHFNYSESDFVEMNNEVLVMTEKDAVKCLPFAKDNWYFLQVRMNLQESESNSLLSAIEAKIR